MCLCDLKNRTCSCTCTREKCCSCLKKTYACLKCFKHTFTVLNIIYKLVMLGITFYCICSKTWVNTSDGSVEQGLWERCERVGGKDCVKEGDCFVCEYTDETKNCTTIQLGIDGRVAFTFLFFSVTIRVAGIFSAVLSWKGKSEKAEWGSHFLDIISDFFTFISVLLYWELHLDPNPGDLCARVELGAIAYITAMFGMMLDLTKLIFFICRVVFWRRWCGDSSTGNGNESRRFISA